jgi:ribosome-associated protein
MIICTGRSSRHVKSIAEYLLEQMKHENHPSHSNSGIDIGEWALLDYADIIVHIMQADTRAFYNLEGLWEEQDKKDP